MSNSLQFPARDFEARAEVKSRLLDLLAAGKWASTESLPRAHDLSALLGATPEAVKVMLTELVEQGDLWRDDQGQYRVPVADEKIDTPATRQQRVLKLLAPWAPAQMKNNWRGMAVAGMIALGSGFVSGSYGGPLFLYALMFGLAFHFLAHDAGCRPGIDFCSKTLLRTGVALLGARITFDQIGSLGLAPIVIVVCGVLVTIFSGVLLSRWFKRPLTEGLLSGGAVAICGASAALAISAVLPQTKDNEKYTLLTVVGVTTLSTMAMVLYPFVVTGFGLDHTHAGIFIGGSIHDVAQVVGAGYLISPHAGDVATFVKLTRVACLVPVVFVIALLFNRRREKTELDMPPLVPVFLIGFVWLMIANSLGYIPEQLAEGMNAVSRACLVVAIAALGVKTSFQALASLGWVPVIMLVAETIWLALFVLIATLLSV
jgi:uncharacterized integral membrane protein (TIGR00698 family)